MRKFAIAVAAAMLAITGCSAEPIATEPEPTAEPAPATEAPTPTPEPTEEPTEEPTPELAQPKAGDELDLDSGGTVAFLAYEQPVATSGPQPSDAGYPDGLVWGATDVRVCVPDLLPSEAFPEENIPPEMDRWTVSTMPWALLYEDGAIVTSSSTGYSSFPQPEYPWGEYAMTPGQCVRGWIVFPAPEDATPSHLQYSPSLAEPRTWEVE